MSPTSSSNLDRRPIELDELATQVADLVAAGGRFAGMFATGRADGHTDLSALVACDHRLVMLTSVVPAARHTYPSVTHLVPPAAWYEREIHDLFGLVPQGHPRLDALVLPLSTDAGNRPRPGAPQDPGPIEPDPAALPLHASGHGLFTLPYGPVRSGVFETVEYLLETVGEDIVHLHTRVHHKHRGVDRRFDGLTVEDGVLLAERVEGTVSVAHALAFCQAIENIAGVEPPRTAALVRVAHAELERIAHHLDSMIRHTEGAGQAVAFARLTTHKERLLRLRSRLCGHRFGRGVVVPGGVAGPPACPAASALAELNALDKAVDSDVQALMTTASFLDRLRSTGVLAPPLAAEHGALGPVGRGSGLAEDVRVSRPYGAYPSLGFDAAAPSDDGDALARQQVRVSEIGHSFHLARQVFDELGELDEFDAAGGAWQCQLPAVHGSAVAWVEAPQGELLYVVEVEHGRLVRVKPRSASFHNLSLFASAFQGDIFTDFAFIEASYGLTIAGAAG